MKTASLLLLRCSLGLFIIAWGGDKLHDTDHGMQVSAHFYWGLVSSASLLRAFGIVQLVLGALIVAGAARRVTYPLLLAITGTTLVAVWRSIVDPLGLIMEGTTLMFLPSLPIFAGALVLLAFRDEDTLAVDARRPAATR